MERSVDRDVGIERGRIDRSVERVHERNTEREYYEARSHAGSPETFRSGSAVPRGPLPPPPISAGSSVPTEYSSPYSTHNEVKRRSRGGKDKDSDTMSMRGPPTPVPGQPGPSTMPQTGTFMATGDGLKETKRKRRTGGRKPKDGTDSAAGSRAPSTQPTPFKAAGGMKSPPSPSMSGSGSNGHSSRPSPTTVGMPKRILDEDYDAPVETPASVDTGAAESLMSLSKSGPVSPTVSVGGRQRVRSEGSRVGKEGRL